MNETILRFSLIIFLILFIVQTVRADVVINEIMPNSVAPESDYEWIELYTNQSVNISNWSVSDAANKTYSFSLILDNFSILACNAEAFNATYPDLNVPVVNLGCTGAGWLNNGAESLSLYNNLGQLIDNYTWSTDPEENVSIGRYPDGSISWYENLTITPGITNRLTTPPQINLELSVYLDSPVVSGISYTKLFKIEIKNKDSCSEKDNIFVNYNITNSTGSLIKESNFTREIGCSGYADTGEWLPYNTGNFTLCGLIINSTVNETDLSDNSACKNITVVENPVALLSSPNQASFGFFNTTFIRLNTTYYDYNKTRFLLYGKNSRVVADWNWDKITSYAECQGETAIEINTTGNRTYFLSIPFFLHPNCDNYYSNGEYEIGLRVCNPKDSGFEKFLEMSFSLPINGRNERLCERQKTVEYKTVYSSGYVSPPAKEEYYEIISYPTVVHIGEEFSSVVSLKTDVTKKVTVYSYVFDEKKLLSDGFDGESWHKTWTANKQSIALTPKSPVTLTLENRIKEDAVPGEYKFRVRIQDEKDLTRDITVLPQVMIESESAKPAKSTAALSCNETDNKIYISINGDSQSNVSLQIFTETGLITEDLSANNRTEETLEAEEGYNYIQLISNNVVLGNCSITKEKLSSITGKFTETSRLPKLLQQLYSWLKEIFNISK